MLVGCEVNLFAVASTVSIYSTYCMSVNKGGSSNQRSALSLLDETIMELREMIAATESRNNAAVPLSSSSKDRANPPPPSSKEKASVKSVAEKSLSGSGGSATIENKSNNNQNEKEEKKNLSFDALELRVGVITSVYKHETADKLYCELIDVGKQTKHCLL